MDRSRGLLFSPQSTPTRSAPVYSPVFSRPIQFNSPPTVLVRIYPQPYLFSFSRYRYTEEKSFLESSGYRFTASTYTFSAASPNGTGDPDALDTSLANPRSYLRTSTTIKGVVIECFCDQETFYVTDLYHQFGGKATFEATLTGRRLFWQRPRHGVVHAR